MTSPVQQSIVLLTSAARTATPTFAIDGTGDYGALTNHQRFRGAHILLDVSALAATPSLTVDIEGYDYGSDSWYNILTSAAVTSISFNIYNVHPDLTAAANLVAADGLPYLWRATVTHADADSVTYTLAVNYLD
jgi:hypothetical protein